MKTIILGLIVCIFVICAVASPIANKDNDSDQVFPDVLIPDDYTGKSYDDHIRVKRFTCDVLSAEAKGVNLNHAACGAHCLLIGKSGGWCDDRRVCNCRK